MISLHLRKLRQRDQISEDEEQAIRALVSDVREVRAGTLVVRQGDEMKHSCLLARGWAARSRDMQDGRRQLIELHVSGDFVDLHSFSLKRLDHNIVTLTQSTIATVPHERLLALTERHPHLARVYWLATNLDAAIQREWTVSLGRRSALQRVAHLFCELRLRLAVIGLADEQAFDFPLTQHEIAECLGMTPVHANRMLQELRRKGLIRLEQRRATILDEPGLRRLADFHDHYLYLERRSR